MYWPQTTRNHSRNTDDVFLIKKHRWKKFHGKISTFLTVHPPHRRGRIYSRVSSSSLSNCQHPLDHQKNNRVPEKTSTSALLTMPKPLTVWITTNCGKFFKRWEYQTTWPASWEICRQIRKQQLELDMEQQTGSKSGKVCIKAIYCHPAY